LHTGQKKWIKKLKRKKKEAFKQPIGTHRCHAI